MKKKSLVLLLCIAFVFSMVACGEEEPQTNATSIYTNVYDPERAETGLTWPEGQALPSFAYPAETVEVVNIAKETNNEKRLLVSLQGIVNRNKPRIALCNGNEKGGDAQWLTDEGVNYTYVSDYNELILKYKDEIKGLVVWDTKESDTINLAHTYAGLHDALAVTEKQAAIYTQEPYNFTILENYVGDFKSKVEIYEYMYEYLWPDCTHRLIMGLGADITLTGTRDLAIAAKCAITYMDLNDKEETAIMEKFLGDMRPGIDYFTGWFYDGNEGGGIELNSKYGIATVPSDFYNNYSIHASLSRELNMPTKLAKPELENKYYIAFVISDGDNLQYVQGSMKEKWNSGERGVYPISWTQAVTLQDAGPQMLNYYYNTATQLDCFVSGPSGAGYTNISCYSPQYGAITSSEEALISYATRTDTYLRRTGIRFVTAWPCHLNSQVRVYANSAPALIGISRTQVLKDQNQDTQLMVDNTPNLITSPWYDGDFPRVQGFMEEALETFTGEQPEFRLAQIIGWDMNIKTYNKMCQELEEKYGDKVAFVTVDQLSMLYTEYHGGYINVALGANVTASSSDNSESINDTQVSYDVSQIVDGSTAKYKGWKCSSEEQWITVDLGESYSINRYYISLAGTGYYDRSFNLKDFSVEYSVDGKTWSKIDVVKENTDNILDKSFEEVEARYVRINITDAGADGIARIQDFEIYGAK